MITAGISLALTRAVPQKPIPSTALESIAIHVPFHNSRLTAWLCSVVVSCQSNLPSRAGSLWSAA
jgi:hypothetical protein